jgi:hypothetical protein
MNVWCVDFKDLVSYHGSEGFKSLYMQLKCMPKGLA